jgi:hypothetical protein
VNGGKGFFRLGYVPRELAPVLAAMRGTHALQFPALRVVSGTWGWSGKTTFGARVYRKMPGNRQRGNYASEKS